MALTLPGCFLKRPATEPSEPSVDASAPSTTPPPAAPTASVKDLRERNTALQLRLLEAEGEIALLRRQLEVRQRILDDAIDDVVRTMSRTRSPERRAEAASGLAEGEIAVAAVRREVGEGGELPELDRADVLLRRSAGEFDEQNFAGALYLTSQAKRQLQMARSRASARSALAPFPDEMLFSTSLALSVRTRSNLREGPGIGFAVRATLEQQTALTGHSYRGEWVRVRTEDGVEGWIHQTLIVGK